MVIDREPRHFRGVGRDCTDLGCWPPASDRGRQFVELRQPHASQRIRLGQLVQVGPQRLLQKATKVKGSREFYEAFDALRSRPGNLVPQRALAEDLALLQKASDLLTKFGVVAPSQVCDGEPARQKGRFATKSSR